MTGRRPGLIITAVVCALSIGRAAGADVDLNGRLVGIASLNGFESWCQVDITQTAGLLSFSGSCESGSISFSGSGEIDVQTGAVTSTLSVQGYCSAVMTTGQADATGYSVSGSGSGCGMAGSFSYSRCGNGVVDVGEEAACDRAVEVAAGFPLPPCCTADRCTFKPADTACNGPGGECSFTTCSGSSAACDQVKFRNEGIQCTGGDQCMTAQCVQGVCRSSAPVADGTPCYLNACGVQECRGGQCVDVSAPWCPPARCCGGWGGVPHFCCGSGQVCAYPPLVPPPGFCVTLGSSPSTTSTTLPVGTPACDALPHLEAARCMIGRALAAPLCDETIPSGLDESLRAKLQSALVRLQRAESMQGTQRGRMLTKIRFSLDRARLETLRATKRRRPDRRLSPSCAVTIRRLIADAQHRIANL